MTALKTHIFLAAFLLTAIFVGVAKSQDAAGDISEREIVSLQKELAEAAMDAAQCIGCGACVAACPNGSAMLFTAAKVNQYALLPQGHPERAQRVKNMVTKMDELGFGNCSNEYECAVACPKGIDVKNIARLNREFIKASLMK